MEGIVEGIVYKIEYKHDVTIRYIGSTMSSLNDRWKNHKSHYLQFCKGVGGIVSIYPYFKEYGYGFYYPEDKTIFLDGEVFINSNLDFKDLKFVEAHEITHLLLGHTGPYSGEDEMDADLGAYILLKNKNLPTEKLEAQFKNRHGVDFDEKLLERVKNLL
jgi:hypothetical protein